jgi:hypothetical protein
MKMGQSGLNRRIKLNRKKRLNLRERRKERRKMMSEPFDLYPHGHNPLAPQVMRDGHHWVEPE